jgi:type II secretory pathway pseudopilin PulG
MCNRDRGQTLLELIFAVGIFIFSILILAPFFLDSLSSSRLYREFLVANFLAQEGLEAARSIRDNNWQDLTTGTHGLAISEGHFVFQGQEEDVSDQLREGKREIQIEDIDNYRKKITSRITWKLTSARTEEVELVTYLTNWQKISQLETRKPTSHTDYAGQTADPQLAYDYPDGDTFATIYYGDNANPSITFHSFETTTKTYTELVLKVRYHADGAKDDKYAIAFSTTTCEGNFADLISPTSASAPDTTLSTPLPLNVDLSQLCVKVYTQKRGKGDNKYLYLRDIFVEGYYLE